VLPDSPSVLSSTIDGAISASDVPRVRRSGVPSPARALSRAPSPAAWAGSAESSREAELDSRSEADVRGEAGSAGAGNSGALGGTSPGSGVLLDGPEGAARAGACAVGSGVSLGSAGAPDSLGDVVAAAEFSAVAPARAEVDVGAPLEAVAVALSDALPGDAARVERASVPSSRSTVIRAKAATTSSQRVPRTSRSSAVAPAIVTCPSQPFDAGSGSILTSTESAVAAPAGSKVTLAERARTCPE
jgi:hypothetical protein